MKPCRGDNADQADRAIRRKVAAFKRKGWTELLPKGEYLNGLFTRELLVSADGKWVAKFSQHGRHDYNDAWAQAFAPFCHAVTTGKRPIAPSLRPLLPVMPYFKRGKHTAVAIMERLAEFVEEGDTRTSAERHSAEQFEKARNVCNDYFGAAKARGPVGTLLREFRQEFARYPDDLHSGNVMLRRGPRGGRPRLVFTDPYAYVRN